MADKVLFTASTYSHILHFHRHYLKSFRDMGWEAHIACAGAPTEDAFADKCFDVPFRKQMRSPENFRAAAMLRDIVRKEGYTLISTHTSLAAFFTRLALKGQRERPKLVNMVHGYLFDDSTPALKKRVLLSAERFAAPETDLLLAMNRWDYAAAGKYRLGKKIGFVPGIGVDFSRLEGNFGETEKLRRKYGIPEDSFVLLYAAEFSRRKSQETLIRAMGELPERVLLVLAGSGTELPACRGLAAKLGLSQRVMFPGYLEDMAPWYALADAACSASRSEGLPFNVMEAMYAGLPVAASAVKGHTDLIAPGETGLLFPYGNAEQCAAQIRRLFDSPELCRELAGKARKNLGQYALDAVLPRVMEQYLSLAGREAQLLPAG